MLYKVFLAVCVILVLGGSSFLSGGAHAGTYLAYSLLALLAFGLELGDGLSMGFVFVILALPRMGWAETILIANSALFIHAVTRRERMTPSALLHSLASTTVAILASQTVFHAPLFLRYGEPVCLMIASGACFLALHLPRWRRRDLWTFPYYPVAAAVAAACPVPIVLVPLLLLTWRSYRLYERRLQTQRENSRAAADLHLRTIETLALAIEAKDQPLANRSRRVQIYATAMAKEMGLAKPEVEAIRAASLLYDIGELAVPEHIISKRGILTPEEFEKVKIHAAVGAELLESVRFPYPVAPIVRSHHERWDGAGYPEGLKGDAIPVGARIVAAADALDALASPRHHRAAISVEQAFERVSAGSGTVYDPVVIALMRKHYKHWEKIVAAQHDGGFVDPIFSAQREAHSLFDLVDKLGNSLDLDATFTELKAGIRALMGFETMVVWLEREGHLEAVHAAGDHLALCSGLRISFGWGISGKVAGEGKAMLNGAAAGDFARRAVSGLKAEPCPFRFALAVPLEANGVRGALTLYRSDTAESSAVAFSGEDLRVLSAVAPKLAMALTNGMKYRRASDQALTDSLTGLPNASALFERLRSPTAQFAVVVCDLDGFKRVNDRFGHLMGNRVLVGMAAAFRNACRGGDFVARLGGDEFVLLLENIGPEDIGARLAQFRELVRSTGKRVCGDALLDGSFGAAFYPADAKDAEALLAEADRNMYRRKQEARANVLRMDLRA
jgi:diguanylate cyclase (GGDEF)-like protein/putative nucleotidyltransferase with HDIG domain